MICRSHYRCGQCGRQQKLLPFPRKRFPMSGFTRLRFLIGASLAFVMGAATAVDAQTTALRGARVIDGSGGAAIDNAVIVIRDGRIIAIGPSAGTPIPSDAEVVDYSGKTIIPGLISDHSHVGIFVGLKSAPENYNRDSILRQLKQLEAYGVTTVMALGLNGPVFYELRPELHAGRLPGADLFGSAASHRRPLFKSARTKFCDPTR